MAFDEKADGGVEVSEHVYYRKRSAQDEDRDDLLQAVSVHCEYLL